MAACASDLSLGRNPSPTPVLAHPPSPALQAACRMAGTRATACLSASSSWTSAQTHWARVMVLRSTKARATGAHPPRHTAASPQSTGGVRRRHLATPCLHSSRSTCQTTNSKVQPLNLLCGQKGAGIGVDCFSPGLAKAARRQSREPANPAPTRPPTHPTLPACRRPACGLAPDVPQPAVSGQHGILL